MSTIATIDFDTTHYDRDADVLYLSVGDPARAVDFDKTPEGHALRYDESGDLIGITIVGAQSWSMNTATCMCRRRSRCLPTRSRKSVR